ncbi:MAG: heme ABC exporter ATP-binding protein CcmA [Hellea sp.]
MTPLFSQMDKPIRLEVIGLTMSRGENTLFEGLSATVGSGDVLWIQGDNGIGKTTLLEAMAGLSRPDEGDVFWLENEQPSLANDLVAYQPHKSFAKAALSAQEDLSFWAQLYGTAPNVEGALTYVGLSDRCDVTTQNLSAGQRRRLALATLIISQKPIWIMDEPSAAMDKSGEDLIDGLICQHIDRGGIAIIASHDSPRKLGLNTRKLTLSAAP